MAVLDAPLRGAAKTLIRRFGKAVTIQARTGQRYDTSTRRAVGTMEQDFPWKVVVEFVTEKEARGSSMIKAGDLKLTGAAKGLGIEPDLKHQLIFGEQEYKIVKVDPIYSGEEIATYTVYARR